MPSFTLTVSTGIAPIAVSVIAGRTNYVAPIRSGATLSVTSQPSRGRAIELPNGSVALVMDHDLGAAGSTSFSVSEAKSGETTLARTVNVTIQSPVHLEGWGDSRKVYMLPVDAGTGRVVVSASGATSHRKVYVAPDSDGGYTAAEISAEAGVSLATVTNTWLRDNATGQTYGASESKPLEPALASSFWAFLHPNPTVAANWLLFKRGHDYSSTFTAALIREAVSGESPTRPMFVGAWGTGTRPIVLADRARISFWGTKNVVFQSLQSTYFLALGDETSGVRLKNILFDDLRGVGDESVMQMVDGATILDCMLLDAWAETPSPTNEDDYRWTGNKNRISGLFVGTCDGVLIDGVLADHAGWEDGFASDGALTSPQPPSSYSHGIYTQWDTSDVTMRNSLMLRNASHGAQFRGGAFVEDSAFIDNNVALNTLGGDYQSRGPLKNYSLVMGNLVTQAAYRGATLEEIDAVEWGMISGGSMVSYVGNIVAHANDPDNPSDTHPGIKPVETVPASKIFVNDTKVRRWEADANLDGLTLSALDALTIQNYAQAHAGVANASATIADYAAYIRTLTPAQFRTEIAALQSYFRTGFDVDGPSTAAAGAIRFTPDYRGSATRWDNRLNWSLGRVPVDSDTVTIPANAVVITYATWTGDITLGAGATLVIVGGQIAGTITGPASASVIRPQDRAGQRTATLSGGVAETTPASWTP